jgi:hypothetical protein
MPIPSTIHFIFGMDPNFGGKPFSYVHYLCVRSAQVVNRPRDIVFHVAHEPRGDWWEAIRPNITLNRVALPSTILGRSLRQFAHRADALRLDVLRTEGGIYLDADVFCVQPLSPLLDRQMVMGIEPRQGLCNAVILAEPQAPFLQLWYERYRDFDDRRYNQHSVRLPYQIAQAHPNLIDVLDEYAFFFPMYDDPSSARLWRQRLPPSAFLLSALKDLKGSVSPTDPKRPKRQQSFFGHALVPHEHYYRKLRQSYCIHLWESKWWQPNLRHLSPETLGSSKGLFRRLVEETLVDAANAPVAPAAARAGA